MRRRASHGDDSSHDWPGTPADHTRPGPATPSPSRTAGCSSQVSPVLSIIDSVLSVTRMPPSQRLPRTQPASHECSGSEWARGPGRSVAGAAPAAGSQLEAAARLGPSSLPGPGGRGPGHSLSTVPPALAADSESGAGGHDRARLGLPPVTEAAAAARAAAFKFPAPY